MSSLRKKAEVLLKTKNLLNDIDNLPEFHNVELSRLLEELRTYQIELELQAEELRQKNMELANTRNEYYDLFDNAPVGYIVIDLKGIVLNINLTASQLLYQSPLKIKNKPLVKYFNPHSMSDFYLLLENIEQDNKISRAILELSDDIYAHTAQKFIEIHAKYYKEENILLSLINVTDKVIARQALVKAKSEAERANKVKSEFIANMSHEFRTPMNAILGFSKILKDQLSTSIEGSAYVDAILKSGNALLNLINDILDISKIEAGHIEVKPSTVHFKELLAEIKQIFSLKAYEKKLELTVEFPPDFPEIIVLDERLVRQVLFNLVGNAIKFTTHGFVKIIVQNVNSTQKENSINLNISVKDSGVGISSEKLHEMFEPFRQQNNTKNKGTGLGLAISKRLMEIMDGQLVVESQLGQGSTFMISLPNIKVSAKIHNQMVKNEACDTVIFNPATFLIINNNYRSQKYLTFKQYLSQYTFKIIEATQADLPAVFSHQQYDIILVCINEKTRDDKVLLEHLYHNCRYIPIIAIAKKTNYQDLAHLFDDFIQKPDVEEEIINVLKNYLLHSKKMSEKIIPLYDFSDITSQPMILHDLKFVETFQLINEQFKQAESHLDRLALIEVAENMEKLAVKYDIHSLSQYAKELKNIIEQFDIEKIIELYNVFLALNNQILSHSEV